MSNGADRSSRSRTELKRGYVVEAQAATLFAFLKQTFFQMPLLVQVTGWLVFLALFVFLVLYPILGITYFQGKIISLADEGGDATTKPEFGMRVYREIPTSTNEDGEFTAAVRVPNIPFQSVEFHLGPHREVVAIPAPIPFFSLFNPNVRKIYYVPASKSRTRDLGTVQHFFLGAVEARRAFETAREPRTPSANRASPVTFFRMHGLAEASEHNYDTPTATTRVLRLKWTGGDESTDVYFHVSVDEKEVELDALANAKSRSGNLVTLIRDTWYRFDEFDIPLRKDRSKVQIQVFSPKLFGRSFLGQVAFDAAVSNIGQRRTDGTDGLRLEYEVLPPMAIAGIAVRAKTGISRLGVWLDVPDRFSHSVSEFRYGDQEFGASRALNYYAASIATRAESVLVRGRAILTDGSSVRLARKLSTQPREPVTLSEMYVAIDGLRVENEPERALGVIEKVLHTDRKAEWALQAKGAVLRDLGRLGDSLSAYQEALKIDGASIPAQVGFTLTLSERSESRREELSEARRMMQEVITVEPGSLWARTALGAVLVRLGEYPGAIDILRQAEELARASANARQQIAYWRGVAYTKLGRPDEAKAAFREVVSYSEKGSVRSIAGERFLRLARTELARK